MKTYTWLFCSKTLLTVALLFGTLVPKRTISSISSRVVMVFKNCSQGLPLKFQVASFGAIEIFLGEFFIGSLTGSGTEMTIIINADRVFRPDLTYMTCCWWSIVTVISVTRVMALKCQKKVRASSRKKSQLLIIDYYKTKNVSPVRSVNPHNNSSNQSGYQAEIYF